MKRTKNIFKTLVIALGMLFGVALALGITAAAYNTSRRANGTMYMTSGIVIDYTGFGKESPNDTGIWQNEQATTFRLFSNASVLPGDRITLNPSGIKKGTGSVDFYARIKLGYKFYTSATVNNEVVYTDVTSTVGDAYSAFLSTPEFATAWVDSNNNDGWFYYATETTLNTVPSADYVSIFKANETIDIDLDATGFNHAGGGYLFTSNNTDYLIKKIEAYLTLETIQSTATNTGWEVLLPPYIDSAGVVYSQNATTGEWALKNGKALGGNSTSTSATVSNLSANIYDNPVTPSYSYTVLSTITKDNVTNNVTAIADEAFLNATQLTAVTIPATVSTIGVDAFTGTGLTGANAVTIESDTVVDGLASAGIPQAATINVPVWLKSSYQTALAGNSIASIESEGLAYTFDTDHYIVTGVGTFSGTNLVIPDRYDNGTNDLHDVTSISAQCFKNCTLITSVIIGNKVANIGGEAFALCSGLESITIPSSVVEIGQSAFSGCTGLTEINYNANISTDFTSSSGIFSYAGQNGGGVTVTIGDNVTNIPGFLFYSASAATILKITSITIPNSVTSIGEKAFFGCKYVTNIDYNANISTDFASGSGIFQQAGQNSTGVTVIIGSDVTCIPGYLFYSNTTNTAAIKYLSIGSSVTSIGASSFYGCTDLISLTIGSSVTSIGDSAFRKCTGLTCLTIGSGVTSIGGSAFRECTGLTEINYNANIKTNYSSSSNVFYQAGQSGSGITLTIGNNVTNIPGYLFSGSSSSNAPKITSLTIGDNVREIKTNAFSYCSGLTRLTIPDGVDYIYEYAFSSCDNLRYLTIGSGVRWIYGNAFSGCLRLVEINYNAEMRQNEGNYSVSVTAFPKAGSSGNGITLTIGENVTYLPAYLFYGSASGRPKITSLIIGNNVTTVGQSAFAGCTSLATVTIDSATIAGLSSSNSSLLTNATTVYVLDGLTVGNYITNSFTAQQTSDKPGYVKYVKNS